MANTQQRDLREYHLITGSLATHSDIPTIAHLPIPHAGQVVRCVAACDVAGDSDQVITFELSGNALQANSVDASMTLENADLVGDIQKIEFDLANTANYALEGEDGDAIAVGATLEIITDGAGTVGQYIFIITIKP